MVTEIPPAGISVALLTPVDPDGEPDFDALDRIVARATAAGVAGLSPVGSTGEGTRLSRRQRREVIGHIARAGLPVVAGVPCGAIEDTAADLATAADAGADAALLAPPGYYPMTDAETVALVGRLADAAPLPLVLYHIPSLARNGYSPAVVGQLAGHPNIAGIKDSGRDLEYLRTVVRATAGQPFRVLTGTDALLAESLSAGATGAVVASANVAPQLAVKIFADPAAGRDTQDRLLDLVTACRKAGTPAGWKAAAALTGLCTDRMVPPATPVPPQAGAALREALIELEML